LTIDSVTARPSRVDQAGATRLQDPHPDTAAVPATVDPVDTVTRREPADPARNAAVAALRFLQSIAPERYAKLTAAELERLESVDLRGTKTGDADLVHLAALPALQSISLRGTVVTDAGLSALRAVPNLTSVDLRATQVSGAGLAALPTTRLEALHLTDTQVKGEDLRWLPPMPRMRVFKLNGLSVDDAALASLDVLPSLRHVELDRTKITAAGLRALLERNGGIQRVELRQTGVSAAEIAEIAKAHPRVELIADSPMPAGLAHR
jgi:hypothetical protein